MGKINAGDLRERVTLLTTGAATRVAGGYGWQPAGPDSKVTVWARVRPLSGRELLALGQTLNVEAYEITIRSLRDATAKQRALWKGKELNVQYERPDEDREYLRLTCLYGGR